MKWSNKIPLRLNGTTNSCVKALWIPNLNIKFCNLEPHNIIYAPTHYISTYFSSFVPLSFLYLHYTQLNAPQYILTSPVATENSEDGVVIFLLFFWLTSSILWKKCQSFLSKSTDSMFFGSSVCSCHTKCRTILLHHTRTTMGITPASVKINEFKIMSRRTGQ